MLRPSKFATEQNQGIGSENEQYWLYVDLIIYADQVMLYLFDVFWNNVTSPVERSHYANHSGRQDSQKNDEYRNGIQHGNHRSAESLIYGTSCSSRMVPVQISVFLLSLSVAWLIQGATRIRERIDLLKAMNNM